MSDAVMIKPFRYAVDNMHSRTRLFIHGLETNPPRTIGDVFDWMIQVYLAPSLRESTATQTGQRTGS